METMIMQNLALVISIGAGVFIVFIAASVLNFIWTWSVASENKSNKSIIGQLQGEIANLKVRTEKISSKKPSRIEFQALIDDLSSVEAPDSIVKILEDFAFIVEDIEASVMVQVQTNESLAQRITSIEKRITATFAKTLCRVKRSVRNEIEKRMEKVFIKLRGMEDVSAENTDKQFGILKRLEGEELKSLEERVEQLESLSEVLEIFNEAEHDSQPPPSAESSGSSS